MSKSALILRHLAFEYLGSLAPVLEEEGYQLVHAETLTVTGQSMLRAWLQDLPA
ncbi:hypothetical protein [Phyllobacterium phragmitis]|uniref:Uncharacterized protein n=1 Tax=Phyllobacterium phragmitis TaxID=2670329 RepID=A0ABQ0H761_9HYPH